MAIVYLITNIENGKRYVGKTKGTLKNRWYNHCRVAAKGSGYILHRAIRKYGSDSFNLSVLETFETEELALAGEAKWVESLSTLTPNGYNATAGGRGCVDFRHTDEECARRSVRMKEKAEDLAWREMKAEHGRAQWADPEISVRNRAAIEAARAKPEYLEAVVARKVRTAAMRAAKRIAKGLTVETMSRSAAAEASHASPEIRALQAEKQRALWADPEWKKAQAARIKASKVGGVSEETKTKASATTKALWDDPEWVARNIAAKAKKGEEMKLRPCSKCGGPRIEIGQVKKFMRCKKCHTENMRQRKPLPSP